jgi:Fur family zinc uptake transcriptional regulator
MTARSMQSAERLCQEKGLAFTPLRRQVYQLIAADPTPVGAYDLLERLRQQRANAAPATIYRALDFLLEAGLVHRIDALQAYAACDVHGAAQQATASHRGLVLICGNCKLLTEFEDADLETQIERIALAQGFQVAPHLIEIRGTCRRCDRDL